MAAPRETDAEVYARLRSGPAAGAVDQMVHEAVESLGLPFDPADVTLILMSEYS